MSIMKLSRLLLKMASHVESLLSRLHHCRRKDKRRALQDQPLLSTVANHVESLSLTLASLLQEGQQTHVASSAPSCSCACQPGKQEQCTGWPRLRYFPNLLYCLEGSSSQALVERSYISFSSQLTDYIRYSVRLVAMKDKGLKWSERNKGNV